jgi:hypothetical protein
VTIFDDPQLNLTLVGRLKTKTSTQISNSRLSVGFETLDRALFKPEPCYDLVGDLGVKFARCQTAWMLCEKEKGVYDFGMLDSVVDNLLERGVEPWFNLTFGNPIYMPDIPNPAAVGCIPNLFGDECRQAWYNYVQALAVHFKGRVRYWEIWNEPNHNAFWLPSTPSGAKYAAFTAETVPFIKSVIPEAKIIGCSAGIAVEFIREAVLNGIGDHIDYFAVHPYGSIPEAGYFTGVNSLKRLFARHAPHVKLMQGECGYPSQTYGHHDRNLSPYNANQTTQAKFVLRRVVIDSLAEMQLISYFHITDLMEQVYRQGSGEARPPVMLGLLHGLTYTPKESYFAMRNLCTLFDEECGAPEALFFNGWTGDFNQRRDGAIPALAPITGSFTRRGFPLHVWYYPEDLQREWCGNVTYNVGVIPEETDRKLVDPVVIDGLTGNVYQPTSTSIIYGSRLFLEGLPLADYPIFLTDRQAVEIETTGRSLD